jgi:pimeloyl-ACP methyl ester carboxylesterase
MTPIPFTLDIPEADIEDLRTRLARTRLPDQAPGAPWAYGTDLDYMRDLIRWWRDHFDWRAQEARLNGFPQFKVPLHGIDVHFIRVEGKGPDPMPLLLMHGWPGSVFEFIEIVPRLSDPARFGGDPRDAFTVIAPSLPGFGLSFRPGQPRFSIEQIADCLHDLMRNVLGYERFGAQGGDYGAFTATRLGVAYPEPLIGIHLNFLVVRRDLPVPKTPSPEERIYFDDLASFTKKEIGYQQIQGTKPQTLAYGLTDSPSGLAAWLVEKFRTWSDCDGDLESVHSRDSLLANICFYWFTAAIGSSFWPYYARIHHAWPIPDGTRVMVPTAYAAFPKEIIRPPPSIAKTVYGNIQRWTPMAKGGHFAAMEQPRTLANEIAAFFRGLR